MEPLSPTTVHLTALGPRDWPDELAIKLVLRSAPKADDPLRNNDTQSLARAHTPDCAHRAPNLHSERQ